MGDSERWQIMKLKRQEASGACSDEKIASQMVTILPESL